MPTPSQEPEEFDAAFESIEQQLSLFWRRARSVSHTISRSLHPEIEPGAYGVLMILLREGPLRVTELAALIGIGKPSVSRQVALLERIGLVLKEDDPADRRAQRVILSPAGAAEIEELRRRRLSFFRDALGSWDLTDLSNLAGYFSRVNEALATAARRKSDTLRHTHEGPGANPAPRGEVSLADED
ncbi:MarR family winged helix-turn-helix transcriptional regulator [Sinomonas humi]|uniref:MarR family winged helix-turn-helix transcriptional regulator n=1 Tax=Sinomonas humi TaxID=1338436 RepID=UPI0006898937|nr:MarR family transcriptional regulator [Sinomonas humi]